MSTGLANWKYGAEALFLVGASVRLIRWAIAANLESDVAPTGGLEYLPGLVTTTRQTADGTTETVTTTRLGGASGYTAKVNTERRTFIAGPGSHTAIPESLLDKLTPEQKKLVLEKLQDAERMVAGQLPVAPSPKPDN